MGLIIENFGWVMMAAGLLTLTSLYPLFRPQPALKSMFGETLEGPLGTMVVRSWSALIVLVGVMLVWGAFDERLRVMALVVAGVSKLIYAGLILSNGRRFLKGGAGISIGIDLVMVVLFGVYLVGVLS